MQALRHTHKSSLHTKYVKSTQIRSQNKIEDIQEFKMNFTEVYSYTIPFL